METLEDFLGPEAMAQLEAEARKNTHYDSEGYATIQRGSEIDQDDVWDKVYEELLKADLKSTAMTEKS